MNEATEGFELFVRVVEAGSVSAAARELGEPRETLSRQLARLEERMGLRLLYRSTRRVRPTPAGELLYARAQPLVAAARAATDELRQQGEVLRGLIRISAPPGGGVETLARTAAPFLARHPEVRLELHATARHVDLVAEGYDMVLRAGTVRDPSLIARTLLRMETVAVASPAWLAGRPALRTVEDLAEHDAILGLAGGDRPERAWPLRGGGEVRVHGRFVSDDLGARMEACRAGLGVALVPRMPGVLADLRDGRMVEVLPGQVGQPTTLSLVMPERALLPARVRALFDYIVEHIPKELGPLPA